MYQKTDSKKAWKPSPPRGPEQGQNRSKSEQGAIQNGVKMRHASGRVAGVIVIVAIVAVGAKREALELPKRVQVSSKRAPRGPK